MKPLFNVMYDLPNGSSRLYLIEPVPYRTALTYRNKFTTRYVGKSFPNGRGMYPYTNPRVVGDNR